MDIATLCSFLSRSTSLTSRKKKKLAQFFVLEEWNLSHYTLNFVILFHSKYRTNWRRWQIATRACASGATTRGVTVADEDGAGGAEAEAGAAGGSAAAGGEAAAASERRMSLRASASMDLGVCFSVEKINTCTAKGFVHPWST